MFETREEARALAVGMVIGALVAFSGFVTGVAIGITALA